MGLYKKIHTFASETCHPEKLKEYFKSYFAVGAKDPIELVDVPNFVNHPQDLTNIKVNTDLPNVEEKNIHDGPAAGISAFDHVAR